MMAGIADLPAATQDYLKVIWTSQEWDDQPISSRALAARLGHSPSTVSETIKRLTSEGLLSHQRYGAIVLTEEGRRAALAMVRRHRLIETFLVQYLGYTWDEVHDEAEVLEHVVSDAFVDRLDTRLGHPAQDPHGDPIPDSKGQLPPLEAIRLTEVELGRIVSVTRVSDADPELLSYLTTLSITLGSRLKLISRHDYAGTVTVRLGDRDLDLGLPAADAIWVT